MYKSLTKFGQSGAFGFALIIILIYLFSVMGKQDMLQGDLAKRSTEIANTGIFDFIIMAAIALTVIAGVLMLLFMVFHTAMDFKNSMMLIIIIALSIILFVVGRSMMFAHGNGESLAKTLEKFEVTSGASAFISGAIFTATALAVLSALGLILSEVRNFFK